MIIDDPVLAALYEWLRSERRLGVRHYGIEMPRVVAGVGGSPSASTVPGGSAVQRGGTAGSEASSGMAGRSASASLDSPSGARSSAASAVAARSGAAASIPLLLSAEAPGMPRMCDRELSAEEARAALEKLDTGFVRGCRNCGLHAQRKQTVFGVGNPRPELVFVGEGPGADEDAQGVPFVGKAGQLLTRMIQAMTLTREQVYICNVVKCRPPGNRTPEDTEMDACSPYLYRQLAILRPKVIVTLGRPATQTLLATKAAIGSLRGQWHDFPPPALGHVGLPACRLMPTFHPAYLLRSPGEKGKAWSDLKQVMEFFGIPIPGGA